MHSYLSKLDDTSYSNEGLQTMEIHVSLHLLTNFTLADPH